MKLNILASAHYDHHGVRSAPEAISCSWGAQIGHVWYMPSVRCIRFHGSMQCLLFVWCQLGARKPVSSTGGPVPPKLRASQGY